MKKITNTLKPIFTFIGENQLALQSLILWALAIVNFSSNTFWYFAVPAIIIAGLSEIVDELRKLNKKENNGKS